MRSEEDGLLDSLDFGLPMEIVEGISRLESKLTLRGDPGPPEEAEERTSPEAECPSLVWKESDISQGPFVSCSSSRSNPIRLWQTDDNSETVKLLEDLCIFLRVSRLDVSKKRKMKLLIETAISCVAKIFPWKFSYQGKVPLVQGLVNQLVDQLSEHDEGIQRDVIDSAIA